MTISTRIGYSRGSRGLALILAVCTVAPCHRVEPTARIEIGGPLTCGDRSPPVPQSGGFYAEVGHPFTFSDIVVRNCATEPAILERVDLVGLQSQMKLMGARAATARGPWISGDGSYPPWFPFPTQPLHGFVVPPIGRAGGDAGVGIVLGLMLEAPGIHGFRSVQIWYRVGPQDYRYVVPYAVVACAPAHVYARDPGSCSTPPPELP